MTIILDLEKRKRYFAKEHWYESLSEVIDNEEQLFYALFFDRNPTLFLAFTTLCERIVFSRENVRTGAKNTGDYHAIIDLLHRVVHYLILSNRCGETRGRNVISKNFFTFGDSVTLSASLQRLKVVSEMELHLYTRTLPTDLFHPFTSCYFLFVKNIFRSESSVWINTVLHPTLIEYHDGLMAIVSTSNMDYKICKIPQSALLVEEILTLFSQHWRPSGFFYSVFREMLSSVDKTSPINGMDLGIRLMGQVLSEIVKEIAIQIVELNDPNNIIDNRKNDQHIMRPFSALIDVHVKRFCALSDRLCLHKFPESQVELENDLKHSPLTFVEASEFNRTLDYAETKLHQYIKKHLVLVGNATGEGVSGNANSMGGQSGDGGTNGNDSSALGRTEDPGTGLGGIIGGNSNASSLPSCSAFTGGSLVQHLSHIFSGERNSMKKFQVFLQKHKPQLVLCILGNDFVEDFLSIGDGYGSGEDKACYLPIVDNLFSSFSSIFVRHLNCIAGHGIARMRYIYAVRNTRWQASARSDEFLLYMKNRTQNQLDMDLLPFAIHQVRLTTPMIVESVQNAGSGSIGSATFSLGLAVIQILNNPFQRFAWDEYLVDIRELEIIESDDYAHHILYLAWRTPPQCRSYTTENVRDACVCLTSWKNTCPGRIPGSTTNYMSREDSRVSQKFGVSQKTPHEKALILDDSVFKSAQIFCCFSISRPDVPQVPGRIRLEVDSDDFLILPSGFIHVRRIDPRGRWHDATKKVLWYTQSRPPIENLRDMVCYV